MTEQEEKYRFAGCVIRLIQDHYCAQNPRRDYDHLGKMIIFPSRNRSAVNEWPHSDDVRDFESAMRSLASFVTKRDAMEDRCIVSMDHIFRCVNKHFVLRPIYRNEYAGDVFTSNSDIGDSDRQCDGVIFIPVSDLPGEGIDRECAFRVLEGEVEEYSSWCTGECYGYVVENENGDELDSCWGFYGLHHARESAESSARSQRFTPVENI